MTGFRPTAWRTFRRSPDGSDLIILITWIPRKEWCQAGKNFPELLRENTHPLAHGQHRGHPERHAGAEGILRNPATKAELVPAMGVALGKGGTKVANRS